MFSYQIIIQDICVFVKHKYAKCLNFLSSLIAGIRQFPHRSFFPTARCSL